MNRERKCAVVDKKKSLMNYIKSDSNNENKQEALKRLSQNQNINIDEMLKKAESEDLPIPPVHSNTEKVYKSDLENKNKIFFHQRAAIIDSFDDYEIIEQELSLLNLESYLSKFDDDELDHLTLKNILTFDLEELDTIKNKLLELKEISQKLNDYELNTMLDKKLKNEQENRENIYRLLANLDKVEDFVIMDESLKFFFKKNK